MDSFAAWGYERDQAPVAADHQAGIPYVCHGVTWATGTPTLLLAGTSTARLEHLKLIGQDIGLKAVGSTRYCTGRYRFVGTHGVEPLACPQQEPATAGGQCPTCLADDEFRFAHQAHQSGHAPPALRAYLAQPHWLYLATFTPTTRKVGTAAASRKTSRLNEQGPLYATYLAQVPDGRTVRYLEDALSQELDLAQSVRRSVKLAALMHPAPAPAREEHDQAVATALAALASWGTIADPHEWSPPAPAQLLWSRQGMEHRTIYPHDLRDSEHGFCIESCLGTSALVRMRTDGGPTRYVVDLNTLKSHRVVLGDFTSPSTATQQALF